MHIWVEQFLISLSDGLYIFYTCVTIPGSLVRLAKEEKFDVTLKGLQCDVFTVSPIKVGCLLLLASSVLVFYLMKFKIFLGFV